jgi:tRNA 2-thiouridine synthesizing protein A
MTDKPEVLDARGLKCPLPVLRTEKRLDKLPAGAQIIVLATDAMARIDIPLYCRQHGHDCSVTQEGEVLRFAIVKSRDLQNSKG